jgi:inosine-uridine nucleoside N-ribohydrolase
MPSVAAGGTVPVVLDSDLDADDLRALAYVAARPDVDLLAVTVAGTGIVRCPAGVRIARAVLARVGHPAVPVACGRSTPLAGAAAFPAEWRDHADAAKGLDLSAIPDGPAGEPETAVELLARAIGAAPSPVRLIVLGPATNVAEALMAHPDLADRIGSVTMMGGALGVPGNVAGAGVADANQAAEWNVFADPTAWQAVLAAGLRPTVVALDATNDVPVTQDAFLSIAANREAPGARLVFDLFDADPSLLTTEQSFWDSLAAVAAFDPAVVTTRPATVRVALADGDDLGRLVEDPAGAAVTIATRADPAAFETRFVATLNGGAAVRPVPAPAVELAVEFDGATCRVTGMPAAIPLGFVGLALDNGSATGAGAGLLLLGDGVSVQDVLDAVARDPDRIPSLGRIVVGAGADGHASAGAVGLATRPGRGLVACIGYEGRPSLAPAAEVAIGP